MGPVGAVHRLRVALYQIPLTSCLPWSQLTLPQQPFPAAASSVGVCKRRLSWAVLSALNFSVRHLTHTQPKREGHSSTVGMGDTASGQTSLFACLGLTLVRVPCGFLRGPQLVAGSGAHSSASLTAHSQTGSSSCPVSTCASFAHPFSHSLLQQVVGSLRI